MRRASVILGVIAVCLLVICGLWLLIAPGQLVKYPSDLDKTAVASGKLTLYVDQATGAPRARPLQLPLSIRRHVRVVKSTSSQATVSEQSVERIGRLPALSLNQQYLLSRTSLKNQSGQGSWAYTPANVVDRSPVYSINLPFDTGSGPYQVYKNEVGKAYPFKQVGSELKRDGVTLKPMEGTLVNAPATSAYLAQLRGVRIAKQITAQQLAAQLKAQGIDPAAISAQVLPNATPAQRVIIRAAFASAVPLKYYVSVHTRLLVEPTTGAIVSLDRIDQTLGVKPDLAGFTKLATILSRPPLSTIPAVTSATPKLLGIMNAPPSRVFGISYGQTPASVADFASYAKGKADKIDTVKTTIPLVLGIAGLLALAVAGGLALAARRRPPAAPAAPSPPVSEPPRTRTGG
ncbi:MAG: porin PorA family protein [Solirubrobacteraceae bacterium]